MRRSAIVSLLALSTLAARSLADDSLTIDLPASHPPAETADRTAPTVRSAGQAPPNRQAAPTSAVATKRFGSRRAQTVSGTRQYTVGRLGVATRTAAIRAARGNSRVLLSRVQPGTYVALNCENGDWYGVLMADRTTGWLRKGDVKILDYEVVSNRQADAAAYTSNNVPNTGNALLDAGQQTILKVAYDFLGVPYKWGGTSPNGMDCSAFVQRCFASVGVRLPRTAREQIACGMPVSTDQLRAADRLYFANSSGEIVHTGIYIGNGYFIHSSSKHKGVAVSNLAEDLYTRMYAGARR